MATKKADIPVDNRVATGVPRLDILLKGGFYKGALYVVQGAPGLGKTIFANQVCFEHARNKQQALFVSLLAESAGQLVRYLKPFTFVNQDAIGHLVEFVSGYQVLKGKGPAGLLDLLKDSVKTRKAKVLVVDGIDAVRAKCKDDSEFREFVHTLQVFAALSGCTTLLLSPAKGTPLDEPRPEVATADGMIELSEHQVGPRAIREIQIWKFRGSDFLKGRHEIEITKEGVCIHPRTEVQFGRELAVNKTSSRTRMAFGIKQFDKMISGGVYSGTMTTVIGAPGAGKTTLGLSFLTEGARQGEPGVYFGFYEGEDELIAKAEAVGIPLREAVKSGLVEIQWQQAVENITDSLCERLLERIRARKKEKIRVFIDGMEGFRKSLAYPERFGALVSALTNELRNVGATTLYSEETDLFGSEVNLRDRAMASVVDNVFYLRYVELRSQLYRLVSILKMRASNYDAAIREFLITDKGIVVSDSFSSAESILTGTAKVISARSNAKKNRTGRKR